MINKRFFISKLFLVGLVLFILFNWYSQYKSDLQYEKYKCNTKEIALRGIIDDVGGRSSYMTVQVNNLAHRISLNIAKVKYKRGFSESYYYQVGDSIVKEANSKEFVIKKGSSMAIYILNCED